MVELLPTMLEVISYGLTAWALGYVAARKIVIFMQVMERVS